MALPGQGLNMVVSVVSWNRKFGLVDSETLIPEGSLLTVSHIPYLVTWQKTADADASVRKETSTKWHATKACYFFVVDSRANRMWGNLHMKWGHTLSTKLYEVPVQYSDVW